MKKDGIVTVYNRVVLYRIPSFLRQGKTLKGLMHKLCTLVLVEHSLRVKIGLEYQSLLYVPYSSAAALYLQMKQRPTISSCQAFLSYAVSCSSLHVPSTRFISVSNSLANFWDFLYFCCPVGSRERAF